MRIRYAAATHQGLVRENNEDNFYVQGKYRSDTAVKEMKVSGHARPEAFLAAVCDGMGGEEAGEVASLLAVKALVPRRYGELPDAAVRDIQRANRAVCRYIMEHEGKRSGTTLAALYIDGKTAVPCNVGDSRIYHFRGGRLTQLSKDHSRAQQMIDMGMLTPEEARTFKGRHVLMQYLGIFEDEMVIDPWFAPSFVLRPGDIYLLCSDGLTDMLWDAEIAAVLSEKESAGKQADRLIQEALAAGGRDNVTALVVHVDLI